MLRRPLRAAIAVLALAASALAALYLVRLELATRWVLRELESRGVPGASLRVTRLDSRGIALADVALGPAFGSRKIALDLDLRSGAAPVRRVRLSEPRLQLDLRPGAPLLGELDAPLRLALAGISGGSGGAGLPALEIPDAEIRLVREGSEAVIQLSLHLGDPATDGSSSGQLHVVMAGVPPSQWSLALKDGSLSAEGTALANRVRALLHATLEPPELHVALEPIEFSPGGFQPVELDARLAPLREVSGKISGSADLRWLEGSLHSSRAAVKLASLGFRTSGAVVEGLAGVIHFLSLSPLASAPAQTLDAAALQAGGIRFAKPHVRFELTSDGLRVEEARLELGSGTLRIDGIHLGPADAVHELTLRLTELELQELLELAAIEGVTGSGKISGTIPLRVAGESIEVHAGVLESTGPGVLRVRTERVRSALGSAGETVEQLVAALEDFHYDTLRLELEKPARGTSIARLHLLGRNPAVLEGRAFALNVNLETDLESVLEAIGTGLQLAGEWTRPRR